MSLTVTTADLAMRQARRLELDRHPAPPAGLEIHASGPVHEVQRGDSPTAIAREYSRAFHMNVSSSALRDANAAAFADGLQPGERLEVPGLQSRLDTFFRSAHPDLRRSGSQLRHVVAPGQTLSSIARHYRATEGLNVTWQSLHAANRSRVGDDPGRVAAGTQLVIPGVSTASAAALNPSIAAYDQRLLLSRTARVQHERGGIDTIDVAGYRADAGRADHSATSVRDAIAAARRALASGTAGSSTVAIAQTRDGRFWVVPVRGRENSEGLDHTDRTLSLAMRADHRSVVAVAERDGGRTSVRRFDR